MFRAVSLNRHRVAFGFTCVAILSLIFPALPSWATEPSTVPGATPGEFKVNPVGAATYSIPVVVPPGIAGLQPDLSLVYNSWRGNGVLGKGWSLNGLSAITRCPQTPVQGEGREGVDLTATDRFCLDGQRLMAVSPGVYGADGMEYRTEVESFTKVKSYGSAGSGPASFVAWKKDGQVLEFGLSGNSQTKVLGNASVLAWRVNKVTDAKGNYLTIVYEQDIPNGQSYPIRIEYTGNANATPPTPTRAVVFNYESTRSDVVPAYVGGALLQSLKRLKSITTSSLGVPVKTYTFAYDYSPATQISRLTSIKECGFEGNVESCLPATSFTWQGQDFVAFYVPSSGLYASGQSIPWSYLDEQHWQAGDVNGDGKTDFMMVHNEFRDGLSYADLRVAISNGDGGFTLHVKSTDWGFIESQRWLTGDVDGDGKTDFILVHPGDPDSNYSYTHAVLHTAISNGDGEFFLSNAKITDWSLESDQHWLTGDADGDGSIDLMMVHSQGTVVVLHTALSDGNGGFNLSNAQTTDWGFDTNQRWLVGDPNGDGRADFMMVHPKGTDNDYGYTHAILHTAFSDGDGGFDLANGQVTDWEFNTRQRWFAGDSNGDGKTDFMLAHPQGGSMALHSAFSKGNGSYELSNAEMAGWGIDNAQPWMIGDVNGDGKTDFMFVQYRQSQSYVTPDSRATLRVLMSDGKGGFTGESHDTALYFIGRWMAGDINGDGKTDFMMVQKEHNNTNAILCAPRTEGEFPDLLKTISSSLGAVTEITHKPLTDNNVYTRLENAGPSERPFQGPLYVVSSYTTDNGTGGAAQLGPNNLPHDQYNRYDYHYEGAKLHLDGRGFLGFSQVIEIDPQAHTETTTAYRQDYPYIGMPAMVSQKVNGFEVNRTTSTYSQGASDKSRPIPYAVQVEQTLTDYDDHSFVTTVTTDSTAPNLYGNIARVTVTTTGATSGSQRTDTSYFNDLVNWRLGLPTSSVVVRTVGASINTSISGFIYDADGTVQRELIEPEGFVPQTDTAAAIYTVGCNSAVTEYGYDVYGQRNRITVSGGKAGCLTASGAVVNTTVTPRTTLVDYINPGSSEPQIRTTNAAGHVGSLHVDARFGVVKRQVDESNNNLTTDWAIDSFGRKTQESHADGTSTNWTYCSVLDGVTNPAGCNAPDSTMPTWTKSYAITQSSDGSREIVYTDALNREVRLQTHGFKAADSQNVSVYTDSQYNELGQVEQISRPYFTGTPTNNIAWMKLTYDPMGRLAVEDVPSPREDYRPRSRKMFGTVSDMAGFNGRQLKVMKNNDDPNSEQQITKTYFDNLGRKVRVTDAAGNSLNFEYDAAGNLTKTRDPAGNTIVNTYDLRGRKTTMDDPDMGKWYYAYNAVGELIWQKDAKGQVSTMVYDVLGRMTQRHEPDLNSTWTYDTAITGKGKLASVSADNGYQRVHTYDPYGRPKTVTTTIDEPYTVTTDYDSQGRVEKVSYQPSGFAVRNVYSQYGDHIETRNAATNQLYWQLKEQDALGRTVIERLGNELTTKYFYAPETGAYRGIYTGDDNAPARVRHFVYYYDDLGNLTQRQDKLNLGTVSEGFEYDNLNRLTRATLNNGINTLETTVAYDALGNITYKSDVGSYSYPQGFTVGLVPIAVDDITVFVKPSNYGQFIAPKRPHAPAQAGGNDYSYDANGNLTAGAGRGITYTSFNMPLTISRSGYSTTFNYDADHARIRQIESNGKTTIYVSPHEGTGVHYEKEIYNGVTTHTHHLYAAGGALIGAQSLRSTGESFTRYYHQDHVGSIATITDENGQIVERLSYDAWGQRRNLDGTAAPLQNPQGQQTDYGFTGQEHLDDLGLVHMNARVYDPVLGRFMSADPVIQDPWNLQNFNRYSYVLNNPLRFNDPTGYEYQETGGYCGPDYEVTFGYEDGYYDGGNVTPYVSTTTTYYNDDYSMPVSVTNSVLYADGSMASVTSWVANENSSVTLGNYESFEPNKGSVDPVYIELAFPLPTVAELSGYITLSAVAKGLTKLDEIIGPIASKIASIFGKGGAGVAKSGAESVANAARLRGQLAGQEIAGGHAFEKHVLQQGEFQGLGIRTRDQFAGHIENVINNPTATKQLSGGRSAYWDDATSTVVIRNPRAADGGTAFQPVNGRAYFDGLRNAYGSHQSNR